MADRRGPEGLLARLARLDRTKVFLATLALAVLGLFLPGALGAGLLLVVVAALAVLLGRTWNLTPAGVRWFRLAVLASLAAIATTKIL